MGARDQTELEAVHAVQVRLRAAIVAHLVRAGVRVRVGVGARVRVRVMITPANSMTEKATVNRMCFFKERRSPG